MQAKGRPPRSVPGGGLGIPKLSRPYSLDLRHSHESLSPTSPRIVSLGHSTYTKVGPNLGDHLLWLWQLSNGSLDTLPIR